MVAKYCIMARDGLRSQMIKNYWWPNSTCEKRNFMAFVFKRQEIQNKKKIENRIQAHSKHPLLSATIVCPFGSMKVSSLGYNDRRYLIIASREASEELSYKGRATNSSFLRPAVDFSRTWSTRRSFVRAKLLRTYCKG